MCPQASAGYVAQVKYMWKRQADAVISQANPTSAALYPVLAANDDVYIHSFTAHVVWTGQPTPLEVVITIDGLTITHSVANPATVTDYVSAKSVGSEAAAEATQVLRLNYSANDHPIEYFGQSIAVAARTTGGTVTNLTCRVKWSRLLPT